ncbi:hypothetical protein MIR68_001604 [Amoeboaphelidium protococcarum]|nr:hypothetical protein MIR68_001604 [Amoeboaphelidium protococcarum]
MAPKKLQGREQLAMEDSEPLINQSAQSADDLNVNNDQQKTAIRWELSRLLFVVAAVGFLLALSCFELQKSSDGHFHSQHTLNNYNNNDMPSIMYTDVDFLDRDVLPTNVKPTHYDLHVWPNLETFKFNAQVTIDLDVKQDSSEIVLNAVEIEVEEAYLLVDSSSKISVTKVQKIEKEEIVRFQLEKSVASGQKVKLFVKYVGLHNDKMAGFYRSQYEDAVSGKKKHLVVTQFEPTDARKALPCWDEPSLKATFDVTITCDEKYTALSNMNDISTKQVGNGQKEVKFATSPIMSTYLLAMVVGELDYIESHTADEQKTLVRVFTTKGLSEEGRFALDTCVKVLQFFAKYFKIAYPLPKMDLVAIPDFSAGAMENFGLVTYRTVYLLFNEKSSAARAKQNIAYVVSHELAHQWFGNLVTFEWWSDLWLNEGFATWAGWLATDHVFPEWKVWTQFVNDDFQRGLNLDSLKSSHPIEVPVKNPAEIHQIFDAISYSKGASVIRMLANYLGEKDFQTGVCNYLQQFKYRNAQTKDLWAALEAASGKPVGKLMTSWTRQVGYPVVNVEEVGGDSSKLTLQLKQQRFLASGEVEKDSLWFIPVQVVTSANEAQPSSDILDTKEGRITLPPTSSQQSAAGFFYKLNFEQTGFYRTNYEAKALSNIGTAIKNGKLSKSDRVGILADAFALAESGHTSVVNGLKLLENFKSEDNYVVWNEIAAELGKVRSIWWSEPKVVTDKLKQLSRNMFGPVAKSLGWDYAEKENHLKAMLRTLVIGVAGKSDDADIIAECRKRFDLFIGGNQESIHPNLRGAVFAVVLRNGGVKEYEAVLKIYQETKVADQKLVALGALGSTQDESLLLRTLDFGLSDQVRPQDIIYVVSPVASNTQGRRLAWKWVKDNWQVLYDRYYSGSMSLLSRIVSSSTEDFSSADMYADVEQFFNGKEVKAISRAIQQSLEKIDTHAKYLQRDRAAVESWASQYTN